MVAVEELSTGRWNIEEEIIVDFGTTDEPDVREKVVFTVVDTAGCLLVTVVGNFGVVVVDAMGVVDDVVVAAVEDGVGVDSSLPLGDKW